MLSLCLLALLKQMLQYRCKASAPADPFEQKSSSHHKKTSSESLARSKPPSSSALAACERLAQFDRESIEATRGRSNAPRISIDDKIQLWQDVCAVASESTGVMLGICAPSQADGVDALKHWVNALQLPRGLLHGADIAGEPITIRGAVFIKYTSSSGDAQLTFALF